jgi:hypothetical protein
MKASFKIISTAVAVVTLFLTTNLKAQTNPAGAWRFSIGPEVGFPTGVARLGANFNLGGTARLQYGITNDLAVTLTSGAYHFFPIKKPGSNSRYDSYGIIPIKAGLKYVFLKGIYVGAEAGFSIEADDSGTGPKRFLLSPALGYACKRWDFAFHYEAFSSPENHFGIVALRLAYGFSL